MISIDKKLIYEELKAIEKTLYNPFPRNDIDKIEDNFNKELSEEDDLIGDLNFYWMNIAGSLSYVSSKRIHQGQIDLLHLSFFDIHQQYRFLEEKMVDYPTFYIEYMNYEKTRKLLVDYLSSN